MLNKTAYFSFGVSLIASILDFYYAAIAFSSTMVFGPTNSMANGYPMMQTNLWTGFFLVMGTVSLATGIISLTGSGMKNMGSLGFLMVLYGLVMASSGLLMIFGFGVMGGIDLNQESGLAMIIVGSFMILQSYYMIRPIK